MAKVIVNLSDTINGFVTKTNQLSNDIGDLANLNTLEDSDIVGAINSVYAAIDNDLDFRNKISVTDAGGDGSLSYSSATGIITYTGPSATEVRAHFSSGTNTTYSSGSFSISDAVIRGKVSVTDAGGDGSLSYNSTTGVITYTGPSASEVRAHLSGGDGIDFASGVISIASDGVARANLKDEVGLVIYNSAGTALKTLYGAGS